MRSASLVWTIGYLLNSAWQLPLLYTGALLAARGMRRMGAEAGHRVWVATLLLCVVLLRRRVAESREMVCDAMAAQLVEGRRQYAQSLLRLALAMPAGTRAGALAAVGIWDGSTGNTLERRVAHMMSKHKELHGPARLAAVAGAVLLGGAICASAIGMRVGVGAAPAAGAAEKPGVIKVAPGIMAGNIETKVTPEYPAKAKADHDTVDGTVTLGATINKDGEPTDLHLVKDLRPDYDLSAMIAVQKWRWKPFLLNGEPVAVETEVNITYKLAE